MNVEAGCGTIPPCSTPNSDEGPVISNETSAEKRFSAVIKQDNEPLHEGT